jgi:hypothetical protein
MGAIALLGLLLLATGLSTVTTGAAADTTAMTASGLVLASTGAASVFARATIDRTGLRYRYGFIHRRVSSGDLSNVSPGRGSNATRPVIGLIVTTKQGKRFRMTALQRGSTPKNLALLQADAEQIAAVLGRPEIAAP